MKSFLSLFTESAAELKKTSAITVCGLLMALSIVLRSCAIPITADVRISFAFLGVMAIAAFFGPVSAVIAAIGIDAVGYMLDGLKARDYNFALLAVKIIGALIYGICLYKKAGGKSIIKWGIISRAAVVVICNIMLNSAVLYYCYHNKNFPFMSASEWTAFKLWFVPERLIKNVIMLPIECVLLSIVLPAVVQAYRHVFKKAAV